MDHPRSRGVYSSSLDGDHAHWGSSPLARGLHDETPLGGVPLLDHPRSRGVYAALSAWKSPPRGSSPLARGLQRPARSRAAVLRIIPARAGFTDIHHAPEPRLEDHPRSRGVYGTRSARVAARRSDHPRSRGVYRPASRTSPSRAGSSPLARGLHGHGGAPGELDGIIPARAGFTSRSTGRRSKQTDHPRSRGVYRAPACARTHAQGSSPLARGLPNDRSPWAERARIIPARAGFT